MIKVLIKDNYFKNPDEIRKIGLSYDNYRDHNNSNFKFMGGWKGHRTLAIRNVCPCCNQTITSCTINDQIMIKHSKNIFDLCFNYFDCLKNFSEELKITSFFHITDEKTRSAFADWQDRYHKDPTGTVSGVVYLKPNAPLKAGTSIVDAENNKIINIENIYNRLVAYQGFNVHAVSDVFGDSKETGRMTYTFFIHPASLSESIN